MATLAKREKGVLMTLSGQVATLLKEVVPQKRLRTTALELCGVPPLWC